MSARAWFLGSAAVFVLVLLWMWSTRPAGEVPLHFGAGGEPDRWGTPLRAITESAIVGAGAFALLGAMAAYAPRMPWSMVNVPHKEAWEPHQGWVRRRVRDDLFLTGAWTVLLIAGLDVGIWLAADDAEASLGLGGAWVAFMLVLFVAGMVVRMRTYLSPPDQLPPGTLDG